MKMYLMMVVSMLTSFTVNLLWFVCAIAWGMATYKVYQEYSWLWAIACFIVGFFIVAIIFFIGKAIIKFISGLLLMAIAPKEIKEMTNLNERKTEKTDILKNKPKQLQNPYNIGLTSSSGEKGNIIVETGYMPNIISTKASIGHYEFCVIGNNMFEYSQRLSFTTIRVYTGLNEAAAAMAAEVARLESVGYKTEVNTTSNAHNMELMNSELALKQDKPMVKKVTGDVCVKAGYKPFVTVQVFAGIDAQYIYLVNNTFIMYEIGKYNTSHIHTYKTQELAGQGLTDYLAHTKSLGFTNIIHPENTIHNALVQNKI